MLTCTTGVTTEVTVLLPPPPPQAAIASATDSVTRWRAMRVPQLNLCRPTKRGRINRKSVLPISYEISGKKRRTGNVYKRATAQMDRHHERN